MPLAKNAAVQDRTFSPAEEVEAIAADLLQGLQYSLVSAAAHPEIRLPFGSLEEAFQEAIGVRPAEQRWIYHAKARRIALGSPAVRQAAFGRYGMFGAEEFACGGLEIVHRHFSEQRSILRSRRMMTASSSARHHQPVPASSRTLSLHITDIGCIDRAAHARPGDEIAVSGLAIDPDGGVTRVPRLVVRDDFENGVRKEYGVPGRRFCEFPVPETPDARPRVYAAAAFLEVADRAGVAERLAVAWGRATPVLRRAMEVGGPALQAAPIARMSAWLLDHFVRWLRETFEDDVIPPGLAFAGVQASPVRPLGTARREIAGASEQFTFAGRRGRYRIGGQWRERWAAEGETGDR